MVCGREQEGPSRKFYTRDVRSSQDPVGMTLAEMLNSGEIEPRNHLQEIDMAPI